MNVPRKFLLAVAAILATTAIVTAAYNAPGTPLAASSSHWDGAQWDGATWDSARWDGATWDGSTWDGSTWDAATWDASHWDAANWDAATWDATHWDGSHWDGSHWDGSNWDASNWDGSRWDASNWDASRWDASNWDASNWDAHAFVGFDPLYKYQWGLRAVNVPGAWALVGPGHGSVTTCVLDSGVDYTHPDLVSQMWRDPKTNAVGYDFVDKDDDPMDVGGHGTHVASIAAARSGDGYGIAGIANAKIMAVRVLDGAGHGTDADLAAGIRYCVDHGARVLSMSLSTDDKSKVIEKAVKYANSKKALIVAAIGNGVCDACLSTFVNLPGVIGVTAMGPDGQLAPFATWTSKTDLAAPGVQIPGDFPNGQFALGSGTSQAVPFVSGIACLMMQANPHVSGPEIGRLLSQTAMPMGKTGGHTVLVVNAEAAVMAALQDKLEDA